MKRLLLILTFFVFPTWAFAQDDTRIVDSLENVLSTQQGAERIKTMIQMVWAFYDVSFDDGIEWGEKALQQSQELGMTELEAEATYALGVQYGYHNDLDLAQDYLKESFRLYKQVDNEIKAFDALWNQAYFELLLGNIDTASSAFQEVLLMAEQIQDSVAYAMAGFNLGIIQYQRNDFEGAIATFKSSRKYYELLNDSAALGTTDVNLATCYGECGRSAEARELFVSLIPRLVALKEYDDLLVAYKNYGLLFERDFINYDSACYYFDKALEVNAIEGLSPQDRQTMSNTVADVLVELGNVAFKRMEYQQAVDYYEEALDLAQNNHYHFGQMQAMVGLGQLYAKQGKALQSLYYLERYANEVTQSGVTMMEHPVRRTLILDYAHLGRFAEMEKELDDLDEQRSTLARENYDIKEQNRNLSHDAEDLRRQHESQNNVIQTLQTQRNHYRLAFFGLLVIVISMLVFFTAYKIVRKKRTKV